MQTRTAPVQEAAREQPGTRHRNGTAWSIVAAVVLGLVAVGLMIWAFDDDASDPQLETVTELVDTMHDGLSERDADTMTSVFTEDAVVNGTAVSIAYGQASVLTDVERVTEVSELGEVEPGSDCYTVVQQFVNAGSGDRFRAPLPIELDGELLSHAEWVPGCFSTDRASGQADRRPDGAARSDVPFRVGRRQSWYLLAPTPNPWLSRQCREGDPEEPISGRGPTSRSEIADGSRASHRELTASGGMLWSWPAITC